MEIDDEDTEICSEPPTKRPLINLRVDGVNDIAATTTALVTYFGATKNI